MITYEDLPRELNLATHFVDRNVEEGGGKRTALIGPGGPTTYAELAGLVNRSGNVLLELGVRPEERVLLVLADSVEFVALWYGAQKIGAVTAEAYTFLESYAALYQLDDPRSQLHPQRADTDAFGTHVRFRWTPRPGTDLEIALGGGGGAAGRP